MLYDCYIGLLQEDKRTQTLSSYCTLTQLVLVKVHYLHVTERIISQNGIGHYHDYGSRVCRPYRSNTNIWSISHSFSWLRDTYLQIDSVYSSGPNSRRPITLWKLILQLAYENLSSGNNCINALCFQLWVFWEHVVLWVCHFLCLTFVYM